MGLVITIAVFAILGFIGWLIYRAIRGIQIKAHHIAYGISTITGIFTYGFFLSMDIAQPIKILLSIILGIGLIFLAAYLQKRRQTEKN